MIERNINVKEELHQNKHIFLSSLSPYNIFLTIIKKFQISRKFFNFLSSQKVFRKYVIIFITNNEYNISDKINFKKSFILLQNFQTMRQVGKRRLKCNKID